MKFFWPEIEDTHSAHRACGGASGVAFFIALVTGAVVWLQTLGKIDFVPGLGVWGYVDAGLFTMIGIGLCFHSRVAAVAGVLLFVAERVFMIQSQGFRPTQLITAFIFLMAMVNGVRGAFAWHIFRKAELAAAGDFSSSSPQQAALAKKKINLVRPLILFVILMGVVAAAIFYLKSSKEAGSAYEQITQKLKIGQTHLPKMPNRPQAAPQGEIIKLKLKTGRQFEGVLIKKNEQGYWLFVEGTGEVFFSPGEIAEVS